MFSNALEMLLSYLNGFEYVETIAYNDIEKEKDKELHSDDDDENSVSIEEPTPVSEITQRTESGNQNLATSVEQRADEEALHRRRMDAFAAFQRQFSYPKNLPIRIGRGPTAKDVIGKWSKIDLDKTSHGQELATPATLEEIKVLLEAVLKAIKIEKFRSAAEKRAATLERQELKKEQEKLNARVEWTTAVLVDVLSKVDSITTWMCERQRNKSSTESFEKMTETKAAIDDMITAISKDASSFVDKSNADVVSQKSMGEKSPNQTHSPSSERSSENPTSAVQTTLKDRSETEKTISSSSTKAKGVVSIVEKSTVGMSPNRQIDSQTSAAETNPPSSERSSEVLAQTQMINQPTDGETEKSISVIVDTDAYKSTPNATDDEGDKNKQ